MDWRFLLVALNSVRGACPPPQLTSPVKDPASRPEDAARPHPCPCIAYLGRLRTLFVVVSFRLPSHNLLHSPSISYDWRTLREYPFASPRDVLRRVLSTHASITVTARTVFGYSPATCSPLDGSPYPLHHIHLSLLQPHLASLDLDLKKATENSTLSPACTVQPLPCSLVLVSRLLPARVHDLWAVLCELSTKASCALSS